MLLEMSPHVFRRVEFRCIRRQPLGHQPSVRGLDVFLDQATINTFPNVNNAVPLAGGFIRLIYSSVYDDELLMLDTSHVKQP